jgi:hypothetical protein
MNRRSIIRGLLTLPAMPLTMKVASAKQTVALEDERIAKLTSGLIPPGVTATHQCSERGCRYHYRGYHLSWTGWKIAHDNSDLVAQWLASPPDWEREDWSYLYASVPGHAGLYDIGSTFDIKHRPYQPSTNWADIMRVGFNRKPEDGAASILDQITSGYLKSPLLEQAKEQTLARLVELIDDYRLCRPSFPPTGVR